MEGRNNQQGEVPEHSRPARGSGAGQPNASRSDGVKAGPASTVPRPPGVTALVGLVMIEVAILAAVVIWYIVGIFSAQATSLPGAIFTLVLVVALAAWQFRAATAIAQGRQWPRAAILVWQLFLLAIAIPSATGGYWLIAAVVGLPAVLVLYLLFTTPVVRFTTGRS